MMNGKQKTQMKTSIEMMAPVDALKPKSLELRNRGNLGKFLSSAFQLFENVQLDAN